MEEHNIVIIVRDCHGRREDLNFQSWNAAYFYCENVMESETFEEMEILAVYDGPHTLYSALANPTEGISWEDLVGFFA